MKRLFLSAITVFLVTTIFNSCSKSNMETSSLPNDNFALSDTAKVIMPDLGIEALAQNNARNECGEKYNTFYGPTIHMGNGHARSWINISHDNKALAIGYEITNNALKGLPEDPTAFAASTFVLPLHKKARALTPFDHLVINWNVHGHEPAHVFDIPHFDFHFYKISEAEQMAIPPYPLAPAMFDKNPPEGYMAPSYFHIPQGVPQMGAHWADLLAPELNKGVFTHTFIYGSYDGKVTFEEPMITLAILQSGNTIHKDFRQPIYFSPVNKYYPTRYNIWKDDDNHRHYVSLDMMIWR
jgi:hypothetical protein